MWLLLKQKNMDTPINFTQTITKLLQIVSTGHRAVGHEVITFSADTVYSLTVPTEARYALMVLEQAGATGARKVIRFWEDGSNPTSTEGLSRGDMDAWDIVSYSNLKDFKAIRSIAGSHKLFIQYYS